MKAATLIGIIVACVGMAVVVDIVLWRLRLLGQLQGVAER